MATNATPSPEVGLSVVFERALDAVRTGPGIFMIVLIANVVGVIPFIGGVIGQVMHGIAVSKASETIGHSGLTNPPLLNRSLYLLTAWIIGGIAILIGLIFLLLPGIYLMVRLYLVPAAVMSDGKGPLQSIEESWDRTDGHLVTVFGFAVVLSVVGGAILAGLYLAWFGFTSPGRITQLQLRLFGLLFGIVSTPIGALSAGGIAVMYDAFEA